MGVGVDSFISVCRYLFDPPQFPTPSCFRVSECDVLKSIYPDKPIMHTATARMSPLTATPKETLPVYLDRYLGLSPGTLLFEGHRKSILAAVQKYNKAEKGMREVCLDCAFMLDVEKVPSVSVTLAAEVGAALTRAIGFPGHECAVPFMLSTKERSVVRLPDHVERAVDPNSVLGLLLTVWDSSGREGCVAETVSVLGFMEAVLAEPAIVLTPHLLFFQRVYSWCTGYFNSKVGAGYHVVDTRVEAVLFIMATIMQRLPLLQEELARCMFHSALETAASCVSAFSVTRDTSTVDAIKWVCVTSLRLCAATVDTGSAAVTWIKTRLQVACPLISPLKDLALDLNTERNVVRHLDLGASPVLDPLQALFRDQCMCKVVCDLFIHAELADEMDPGPASQQGYSAITRYDRPFNPEDMD